MHQLKDLNWNHLYYFYELAKNNSLTQTAKSLGIASSTLSEQLKRFETNLGKKLFSRSAKGMSLTSDGVQLFEHARIIFDEGYKLLDKFSEETLGGYPVNVGIVETISNELAAEFASQYWDLYAPYGTVNTIRQIEHEVLVENILNEAIDWGISLMPPKRKALGWEEIERFEIVFCCSSELFDKFKDIKDLMINIPFAETSQDTRLNRILRQHLRKNGIVPREYVYTDHYGFVRNLCERGRCVMVAPKNPLDNYDKLKTFVVGQPLEIKLYAIWKKSDEGLVSVKKLRELINSKLHQVPDRYKDVDYQIEVSDVSEDLLT